MSRLTVDFGIDLGTTNSTIAVINGTDVNVIRNNEGFEYTPSAVFIDKHNALIVGRTAKERIETDSGNAKSEFKLQMGTGTDFTFARSGRQMKPEELSAEVLKRLKEDVKQRLGEEVRAAAITVPAAFELPQCEATNRAAQLAGMAFSPLLQEPVAAALAYGFQTESDKVFWLVYDFGGGTFDAAVIQVRDRNIQVVNHGGDNHLGGKLIDWEIVEKLLIPALVAEHNLPDFRRGNPKYTAAIAKLKSKAEEAKIRVSRDDATELLIDFLCTDASGDPVSFEYELRRADVERLAEPFFLRTINICKKVLQERRLTSDNIERVLLVGGPTMMPYLRERLADPKEGLGMKLEFGVDPLTVVARGAAIFAGSQRIEQAAPVVAAPDELALELDYKPIGPDQEFLIGGRVNTADSAYQIEFINAEAQPPWRSGKIALAANGAFVTTLWAEKGRQNIYEIELRDGSGSRRKTAPGRFPYTVGLGGTEDPPLIHSIGIALANNQIDMCFEKGAPLPARKRLVRRQAFPLNKGNAGDAIRIPVVEGNHKRADRNKLIGYLQILATDPKIKRDVPAGAEVEITIEIDKSRLVTTKAYIPLLDEEFKDVLKMESGTPSLDAMRQQIERERRRLEDARSKVYETGDPKALAALDRIEDERLMQSVTLMLDAGQVDPDAAGTCYNLLLNLRAAIDELEDALETPGLVAEARNSLDYTDEVVAGYGTDTEKRRFELLKRDLRTALDARPIDAGVLRRRTDEMDRFRWRILSAQPSYWTDYYYYLESHRDGMKDPDRAEQLFEMARRALSKNNFEDLRSACRQLIQLLPPGEREKLRGGFDATIL